MVFSVKGAIEGAVALDMIELDLEFFLILLVEDPDADECSV